MTFVSKNAGSIARRGAVSGRSLAAGAVLLLFAADDALAGGGPSAMARVDRVQYKPSAASPQQIVIHGVFATRGMKTGPKWSGPQSGYMYYSCPAGAVATRKCVLAWKLFEAQAGAKSCLMYGHWGSNNAGTVRRGGTSPSKPDLFPAYTPVRRARWSDDLAICVKLGGAPRPDAGLPKPDAGRGKTRDGGGAKADGGTPTTPDSGSDGSSPRAPDAGVARPDVLGSSEAQGNDDGGCSAAGVHEGPSVLLIGLALVLLVRRRET